MRLFRVMMFVLSLAVLGADGVARAEESASAAAVAAAGELAPAADDSAPATKGDFRRLQGQVHDLNVRMGRMEERMDNQEQELREMRGDLREIRAEMQMNFRWLLAAIIAVLGLPHFFGWVTRMRANGRSVAAAALMLAVLAGGAALAASSCEAEAAMEGESVQSIQGKFDGVVNRSHQNAEGIRPVRKKIHPLS